MSTLRSSNGNTFTSTTSRALASLSVVTGDLMVASVGFRTLGVTGFSVSDSAGTTNWANARTKVGSNPSVAEIHNWWAVAESTGTFTITASWTGNFTGGMVAYVFNVGGTGDIGVASSDDAEALSATTHYIGSSAGLNAQNEDVMFTGGALAAAPGTVTAGGSGAHPNQEASGWSGLTESRMFAQYRLPSGTVTGSKGPWTAASTTGVTAMVIFRRIAAAPEAEFVLPRITRAYRFPGGLL